MILVVHQTPCAHQHRLASIVLVLIRAVAIIHVVLLPSVPRYTTSPNVLVDQVLLEMPTNNVIPVSHPLHDFFSHHAQIIIFYSPSWRMPV